MSEIDRPFPVWRAVLAVALGIVAALALMPALTLAPPLLFWGGPIGPFFALILAPLIGLVAGPFLAPLTFLLAVLVQSFIVFGLTALGRTHAAATSLWAWAFAGLAAGALAGTALGLEIAIFGFELPRTIVSGALTGLASSFIAHAIMTFRTKAGRTTSDQL